MYLFLIPLLLGFCLDWASAFTTFYTRRWGVQRGRWASALLRDVIGIPLWVIGLILAVRSPSAALFQASLITDALSWLLILFGAVVISFSLLVIGRRAAVPSVQDSLVESGLYAYVRHPIYSAMFLEFAGIVLYSPTIATLIACSLAVIWALVQARLEEKDLVQRIPAYSEYLRRVPRFIPEFRKRTKSRILKE